jgi:lipoyl(octanoyl) transferase
VTSSDQRLAVRRLGTTAYGETLERMRAHVGRRATDPAAVGDELWLTEHPPVFTLGFASRNQHLLNTGDIPVVETERGGQVTYHGPGQVVAYLLLDLRRRKLGVRELVCRLETGIIACLAGYGIAGLRKPDAPGIYIAGRGSGAAAAPAKIASIGLKVSRGFTWHGVALNGRMDLEPFSRIDPCGYPGLRMTDVHREAAAGVTVEAADLADRLADALVHAIGR